MNSERPPSSTVRDMPCFEGLAGGLDQLGIEFRRSPAMPVSRPSSWTISQRPEAHLARLMRAELARWESAGSGVTTADRAHRRRRAAAASITTAGATGSTRTSIVPPQARPDVPRLLVADPVADDPGVAGRAGVLDLLGRGAFDAAAAHRPAIRPSVA